MVFNGKSSGLFKLLGGICSAWLFSTGYDETDIMEKKCKEN